MRERHFIRELTRPHLPPPLQKRSSQPRDPGFPRLRWSDRPGGKLDRQAKVAARRRGENDFYSMAWTAPSNCTFPLRRKPSWHS